MLGVAAFVAAVSVLHSDIQRHHECRCIPTGHVSTGVPCFVLGYFGEYGIQCVCDLWEVKNS